MLPESDALLSVARATGMEAILFTDDRLIQRAGRGLGMPSICWNAS